MPPVYFIELHSNIFYNCVDWWEGVLEGSPLCAVYNSVDLMGLSTLNRLYCLVTLVKLWVLSFVSVKKKQKLIFFFSISMCSV